MSWEDIYTKPWPVTFEPINREVRLPTLYFWHGMKLMGTPRDFKITLTPDERVVPKQKVAEVHWPRLPDQDEAIVSTLIAPEGCVGTVVWINGESGDELPILSLDERPTIWIACLQWPASYQESLHTIPGRSNISARHKAFIDSSLRELRVYDAAMAARRRAVALRGTGEALRIYRDEVLAPLEQIGERRRRWEILLEVAEIHLLAGDRASARAMAEEAMEVAEELGAAAVERVTAWTTAHDPP